MGHTFLSCSVSSVSYTLHRITTTYYERAQEALLHPRLTIAAGFADGQDEFYDVSLDGEQPTFDHALVLRVLEILDEELRPHSHPRLQPVPCFLVGYLAGYVYAYLKAVAGTERSGIVLAVPHPEAWMSVAYREIALSTPHDAETIEGAYEEGQNLLYSLRHDGPLPTERELTLEALKMFDEAMRPDPLLPLPASPNWAVGFLSGFIQTYVEGQLQHTEPLPQVAKEEA